MAFCPGSTTPRIKAGYAGNIVVGAAALGASLNNVPVGYAVPFAALVAAISVDLTHLCGSDPPTQPTMTVPDWVALAGPPGLAEFTGAQAKFTNWCIYFLWGVFCECTGGTTPALTIPSAPASLPQLSPPVTSGPLCDTVSSALVNPAYLSFTSLLGGGHQASLPHRAFPPGAASITMVCTNTPASGTTDSIDFTFMQYNATPGEITPEQILNVPSGQTLSATFGLNTACVAWSLQASPHAVATTNMASATVRVTCGTALGPVGCCPEDPVLLAQISQILSLVTLIQRQGVPFAYIASTVHTGLVGAGSISIADLLGVRVSITTDSPHLGTEGTSPTELFDRGWITFATSDGALHSTRIEHATQLVLPCQAGIYTTLYYDLNPLITVSITELAREP